MSSVSIIDYGVGNIRAFVQVYKRLNIDVSVAQTAADVSAATRLVLPGVGAFDWAMGRLNASGLRSSIDAAVMDRNVPVIGICVGMQMMAASSDEGKLPGLGWIDAEVRHFDVVAPGADLPHPHMGWNDAKPAKEGSSALFAGMDHPRFYFLHSYCVVANDAADIIATTEYGVNFTSALNRANVYATQFHPEKSHQWGVRLLQNFASI